MRNVTDSTFESVALDVFQFQSIFNPLYRSFLDTLRIDTSKVKAWTDIPCLPISMFKRHRIQTGTWPSAVVFTSSGTTGATTSRHLVRDVAWYDELALQAFERMYGQIDQFVILALLPAYLERTGSSLVHMANHFIQQSKHPQSGFFLSDYDEVDRQLRICAQQQQPTLLLGVSFALWDMAERGVTGFPELVVMETGGMKGRRREITRSELHTILSEGFAQTDIHSEYGMTELLSQAYSKGDGIFEASGTMRVWFRDVTDPFARVKDGKTGGINITDLANIDSVSFIATDDVGRQLKNNTFEVLGRLDASDIRGCNLMVGTM
ncbi:MAG: acyl transferase [Saprospiraceae bacterium]|nr:acyl transferase [Saprospiraceae bacterium]